MCVSVCREQALVLADVEDDGLRPMRDAQKCVDCGRCLEVCPGIAIDAPEVDTNALSLLQPSWGNVLEIWEGHARDDEIRYLGSSGGIATALSLFCLDKAGFDGILHTGVKPDQPLSNEPVLSLTRAELLSRAGSRYAPAAPCSGLPLLDRSGGRYAFVGKPCDGVAIRRWQKADPDAGDRIALTISIFCAGTPSTQGTKNLLNRMGANPDEVTSLRYRGCGWPGCATADMPGRDTCLSMSYEESWGEVLSKHTQFRCRLCPDSTGELADISCGDPWYRDIEPGDPGRSLVLVRTEAGRQMLKDAIEAGYVQLEKVDPSTLPRSQPSLLNRRRQLWGRLLAMRMARMPAPRYRGFSLRSNWRQLSLSRRLRCWGGMAWRIYQRKWAKPQSLPK